MPPVDAVPDSLRRALERRNAALSLLARLSPAALASVWREAPGDTRIEVASTLVEVHGLAKRCAQLARVTPKPLAASVSGGSAGAEVTSKRRQESRPGYLAL